MELLGARVVWRDSGLLVLDKPAGLPVLADRSGAPCLWDALKQDLAPERLRPLAVHRIDKGTSGLLLVALDAGVQRSLGAAFESGGIGKWYAAIGHGVLPDGTLEIDLPLAPGRKSRWRVAGPRHAIVADRVHGRPGYRLAATSTDARAKAARTRVRTVQRHGDDSLFCVRLLSGRTHQIRVHLAWVGSPLRGDHLYGRAGDPAQAAPRLALHCHRLQLPELSDGVARPRSFRAPLPADFSALLEAHARIRE